MPICCFPFPSPLYPSLPFLSIPSPFPAPPLSPYPYPFPFVGTLYWTNNYLCFCIVNSIALEKWLGCCTVLPGLPPYADAFVDYLMLKRWHVHTVNMNSMSSPQHYVPPDALMKHGNR